MPVYKRKHSDEDLLKIRQDNARKLAESRKKKTNLTVEENQSQTASKSDVPESNEQTPATPAAQAQPAAGGPDSIMEVPDINKISPFSVEPKIEDHVTNGSSNASSPPKREGDEAKEDVKEPFDGDIGNRNIKDEIPKPPSDDQEPPVQPGQDPGTETQPGNKDGNTIKPEQAEKAFQQIVNSYNHAMITYVSRWLAVKPEKVKEFVKADQSIQEHIRKLVDEYNKKNSDLLVLTEEDIRILHDPAVAVLQEEGVKLSNKDLLLIAIGQVMLAKMEFIAKIIMSKKHVVAEMKDIMTTGVNEMNNAKRQANDILHEVSEREESIKKSTAEFNAVLLRYEDMKKEMENAMKHSTTVDNPVPREFRTNFALQKNSNGRVEIDEEENETARG